MGSVWVIAGPIASGKSLVARLFRKEGARTVDADQVGRELLAEDASLRESVLTSLGQGLRDESGGLDRRALAEVVFADADARTRLEAILHPPILEQLRQEAETWRQTGEGLLLLEVVLWLRLQAPPFAVDGTIALCAPEETLIDRVMARDSLRRQAARERLAAQAGWEQWLSTADHILETDCSEETLRRRVRELYRVCLNPQTGD